MGGFEYDFLVSVDHDWRWYGEVYDCDKKDLKHTVDITVKNPNICKHPIEKTFIFYDHDKVDGHKWIKQKVGEVVNEFFDRKLAEDGMILL